MVEGCVSGQDFFEFLDGCIAKSRKKTDISHLTVWKHIAYNSRNVCCQLLFERGIKLILFLHSKDLFHYIFIASGTVFTNNFSRTVFVIKSTIMRADVLDWSIRRLQWKFKFQRLYTQDASCFIQFCRASDRSRKKKSNFAGFLGTNSWKIGRFRGNFRGKLGWKAIGKKTADFVVIFWANFARNRSVLRWSDQRF